MPENTLPTAPPLEASLLPEGFVPGTSEEEAKSSRGCYNKKSIAWLVMYFISALFVGKGYFDITKMSSSEDESSVTAGIINSLFYMRAYMNSPPTGKVFAFLYQIFDKSPLLCKFTNLLLNILVMLCLAVTALPLLSMSIAAKAWKPFAVHMYLARFLVTYFKIAGVDWYGVIAEVDWHGIIEKARKFIKCENPWLRLKQLSVLILILVYQLNSVGPIIEGAEEVAETWEYDLSKKDFWKTNKRSIVGVLSLSVTPFNYNATDAGITVIKVYLLNLVSLLCSGCKDRGRESLRKIDEDTKLKLRNISGVHKGCVVSIAIISLWLCGSSAVTGAAFRAVDEADLPIFPKGDPVVTIIIPELVTFLMNSSPSFIIGCGFIQFIIDCGFIQMFFSNEVKLNPDLKPQSDFSALESGVRPGGALIRGDESPQKERCMDEERTATSGSSQSSQLDSSQSGSSQCLNDLDYDTGSSRAGTPSGTSRGATPGGSSISPDSAAHNPSNSLRMVSPTRFVQEDGRQGGEGNLPRPMPRVDEERSLQASREVSPLSGPAPAPAQVLSSYSI